MAGYALQLVPHWRRSRSGKVIYVPLVPAQLVRSAGADAGVVADDPKTDDTVTLQYQPADRVQRSTSPWHSDAFATYPWLSTAMLIAIECFALSLLPLYFDTPRIDVAQRSQAMAVTTAAVTTIVAVFASKELVLAAVFPLAVMSIGLPVGQDILGSSINLHVVIVLTPVVAMMSAYVVQFWASAYRVLPEMSWPLGYRRSRRQSAREWAWLGGITFLCTWLSGAPFILSVVALGCALWAERYTRLVLNYLLPLGQSPPQTVFGWLPAASSPLRSMRRLYHHQTVSVRQYTFWKTRTDPIFAHIESAIPRDGVVLDGGCGYGLMSNLLAMTSPHRQVIGVDLHVPKIRVARVAGKSLPNVRFKLADLLDWPFPPCDALLMIDISHYWAPAKQIALINKAATALQPGGRLIFRETFRINGRDHAGLTWFEKIGMWTNVNPRGEGLLYQDGDFYRDAFRQAGLTIVAEQPEWGLANNHVLILEKPRLIPSVSGRG